MRELDANEYITVLKELTEQGKEVSLLISGDSMTPFLIHHRDLVCFKKKDRKLKKGDMVFFQRSNGQYVMHRIHKIKPEGYYIVGDAQINVEGPVKEEQIFAVITKVRRKGKWIESGDLWWEFFAKVWIRMIPARLVLMRGYGILEKIRSKIWFAKGK